MRENPPWQIPEFGLTARTFIDLNLDLILLCQERKMFLTDIWKSLTDFAEAKNLGIIITYDRVTRAIKYSDLSDEQREKKSASILISNKHKTTSDTEPNNTEPFNYHQEELF